MQSHEEKPTKTLPGIKLFSRNLQEITGILVSLQAMEPRSSGDWRVQEEIEECMTLKGEPSKIMDLPVCLPPLTIKVPSREFADEKKNSIVVDVEGAKDERTSERATEEEEKDECTTPKGEANRIPAPTVCPPPPARRFKRPSKQTTEIPLEKYFPVPADLTSVFIPLKKIRTSYFSALSPPQLPGSVSLVAQASAKSTARDRSTDFLGRSINVGDVVIKEV